MNDFNEFELHSPDSLFQEGMDMLESDHLDEALHAFDSVLALHPYHAEAFFQRGITLVRLGDLSDAIKSFESAISCAPTEALFHSHCGYALLMSGKTDAALEKFDYALSLQPDSYENKVYKACALAEHRRLHEALQLLEEVLSERPDDPEVLRHYGNILLAVGDDHEALMQFDRIIKINPNQVEAILRRGYIYLHQGNRPEAVKCFREYLALRPEDRTSWIALLEILTDTDKTGAVIALAGEAIQSGIESPRIYYLRGMALLNERQFDSSILDLKRARSLQEYNPEIHMLLAQAFMERGRLKHSLISINRVLQLLPKDRKALLLKARILQDLSDLPQELDTLNELISLSPDEFRFVQLKAENLSLQQRFAEACETIDSYLIENPRNVKALLQSADLNELLGNVSVAKARFKSLLTAKPVSAKSYKAFAGFLIRREDKFHAAIILDKATEQFPLDPSIQTLRAIVYQTLERHEECIKNLRDFISAGRAPAEVNWLLGKSYYAISSYENALESFQQARISGENISLSSDVPEFKCLIAEAYSLHGLNRTAEAINLLESEGHRFENFKREYYEILAELYNHICAYSKVCAVATEGLREFPHNTILHYRLSRCSAAIGRKATALRHLSTAISLEPKIIDLACRDNKFQRYALSIRMNKLVNFYFLRKRFEFIGLVIFSALICLITAWFIKR